MSPSHRAGQDEILQIRNDLMTLYREIGGGDERLFPLRYARAGAPAARAHRTTERRGGRAQRIEDAEEEIAPILLLPDGPGAASVLPFDVLRRSMTQRGLDVIMPEHRGVGLSRLDAEGHDLPVSAMRVQEVIGDLLAVLDHARVERAVVCGSGYGAYLALALAALHPHRVHSLVLDSPLVGAQDELEGQAALRAVYWDGEDPATASIARSLRSLVERGVIDARRAGPVVLAVHEYGGPPAVGELVDLLARGRGRLTWTSVRQVLQRARLQSTPFVHEGDLVARIAHTELGLGSHADGGPLDVLQLAAQEARGVTPFAGEPYDLWELSRSIQAPTLILSGTQDLVCPPAIAHRLAARMDQAQVVELPGIGHDVLDTHSSVAVIAAWWSAAGRGHLLPARAAELAALPRAPVNLALAHGLRIAMTAERLSPIALWLETARSRRAEASIDPDGRRARRTRAV